MADDFDKYSSGLDSPAQHAAAVTPNDDTDLTKVTRALFVGTGGNIVVIMAGGETVTFTGVLSGSVLPFRIARVKSTLTTAQNIVALW